MGEYKVYVHINKLNGKRYYGITKQKVKKRWDNGHGYRHNKYFTNAIEKYGWNEGFEHIIVANGLLESEAKWLEIELIKKFNTINRNYGYNISPGGESNNHSEETKRKISESNKGRKISEEHKKKIREANKSRIFSEEARKKISDANKGRPVSEETKMKLSKANKGKTMSKEARKKMSDAQKGKNNNNAKSVCIVELNITFDTITDCSKFLKCNHSTVSRALNGITKTCKGYHITYKNEVA